MWEAPFRPNAASVELLRQILRPLDGQSLAREPSPDAIGHPHAVALHGQKLPVQLARILFCVRRHPDHALRLPLSGLVAQEQVQELPHIEAVGLGSPLSSVHLDARRVHTRFSMSCAMRKRCSQKPSRPAS